MNKRIIAAVFDLLIYLLLFFLVNPYIVQITDSFLGQVYLSTVDYVSIASLLFYFILLEVLLYTSPGKWLNNLKISTANYTKPKRRLLLLRAILNY